MDDITLMAKLASGETVYVSPVHSQTYAEYVDRDNLGGASGYFISCQRGADFEVLAKATSLDSARTLFGMIVATKRHA
ncbi:hypothetical protein [Chelatococcus asaccharovorans]|uniref:Uncharacterized protein n=1 Tax=Chelatococcus asaccharovorans TaxID=28210 RepID=A0A2V3U3D1_9HYPH|nr:hypothetical protein [Chelatococcus asaccharovorans]MBS7702708.1 hypothetical protein [Chelatococcus asaccharovorans]PXW57001.1 hypothetical protein C7450_10738 [Chelatococcus asaccharovorans]